MPTHIGKENNKPINKRVSTCKGIRKLRLSMKEIDSMHPPIMAIADLDHMIKLLQIERIKQQKLNRQHSRLWVFVANDLPITK